MRCIKQALIEKIKVQELLHAEHEDSLYECINVLKHHNLKLEDSLRQAS
jgi:hypothetical protein